jgi:vacuolar-type H+-ATPase subunit I/STV1
MALGVIMAAAFLIGVASVCTCYAVAIRRRKKRQKEEWADQ